MTAWADIEPGTDPPVVAIGASRSEYDICRQIPGARHGDDDLWRFPLTWPGWCAFSAIWSRQPVYVYPELGDWVQAAWAGIRERYRMRTALDAEGTMLERLLALEHTDGPQLTAVQRGSAAWLMRYPRGIYGDPRGNGKTPPLCRALELMDVDGEAAPALVACPPQGMRSWATKLSRWAPRLRPVIVEGSQAARAKALAKLRDGEADVALIGWGNLYRHTRLALYPGQAYVRCDAHGGTTGKTAGVCEVHDKEFQEIRLRTVIADEAHWMADPTSKQARAMWWLMHHAEHAWAVTGTLTPNDPGEYWSLLHGIDPLGHPVRSRYLDLYAMVQTAWGGKGQLVTGLRPDTRQWFDLATLPYLRRIPKEIARAGEPAMAEPEFRYPEMAHKQRLLYNGIAKAGTGELADRDWVPGTAIAAFTRLCQLASAMVAVTDAEDPLGFTKENAAVKLVAPSHKIDDLLEFLREEEGQWIVALNSPMLAALAEARLDDAGIPWRHVIGGMSGEEKYEAEQAFTSGDARVIIINEAGKEVIDLQTADGIFWMQPDPSFTGREQKTGRGDRFGRTTPLRQVWSLTPGTVDIRLYTLGLDKAEQHEHLVQDARMLAWMLSVQPGEIVGDDHGNQPEFV